MLPRKTLEKALRLASSDLAAEYGRDTIFAAPLAIRVMFHLKSLIGDSAWDKLTESLDTKNPKLTGKIYGQALYPDLPESETKKMKFRQFLEAFPDLVQVFPVSGDVSSGDMVRLLDSSRAVSDSSKSFHRSLLLDTLTELLSEKNSLSIPINQLGIRLKKRDPSFTPTSLGYRSLSEWVERIPEVTVLREGSVMRLSYNNTTKADNTSPVKKCSAYVLVDSSDLHRVMHELLGRKPTQASLPEWSRVLQYCQDKWPDFDWKGRFFLAVPPSDQKTLQGLAGYLSAVGFKPVMLNLQEEPLAHEELISLRNSITSRAILKAIQIIRSEASPGAILIASHDPDLADEFTKCLRNESLRGKCGVICFPEKLPPPLKEMTERGMIAIDLERDCKAFKEPLKRSLGLSVEQLSAYEIL